MSFHTNDIAYQNKDITSKIFAEKFKGKSLKVYGIDLPKIKYVLPTNLPAIHANELRMDNLFLLEDDTFLIIDYESGYKSENKLKYLSYVLRILEKYSSEYGMDMKLQVCVIYTADVTREQTKNTLDAGSVKMQIMESFLSELKSEEIREKLIKKIKNKETLSDEELMQYIILPLSYRGMEQKQESIKELFELTKEIKEEEVQLFLLSGILVFTDKVIDDATAKRIKEWMRMTKVARLFEEEKEEAIRQTEKATAITIAKKMLKNGSRVRDVVNCVTYLSVAEVEALKEEVSQ